MTAAQAAESLDQETSSSITLRATFPDAGRFVAVPKAKRVYFEKDILRTGPFFANSRWWNLDHEDLKRIQMNAQRALARGHRIPMVWGHPEPDDASRNFGQVVALAVRDGKLFARFWVGSEEDALKLSSGVAGEVSVRLDERWRSGDGRWYSPMLTHVGVVNLPVLSRQGPMIRLTLSTVKGAVMGLFGRRSRMSTPPVDPATCDGQTTIAEAFDVLSPDIETIATAAGLKFPNDTSPDTLVAAVHLLAQLVKQGQTQDDEQPAAFDEALPDPNAIPMSTTARRLVRRLQAQRDHLARRVEELNALQLCAAESDYAAKLDGLIASGRLQPAERDEWWKLGEVASFRLSTLAPLERLAPDRAAPLGRKTAGIALLTGSHLSDGRHEPSEERIQQLAKTYR